MNYLETHIPGTTILNRKEAWQEKLQDSNGHSNPEIGPTDLGIQDMKTLLTLASLADRSLNLNLNLKKN
jgi:hypothetical protein